MFTERFNVLLTEVCCCSDGEFARCGGYDRSYISHLRRGSRTPHAGRRAAERLTHAICACAAEKNALDALRRRVGAAETTEGSELCAAVSAWLYEGQVEVESKKNAPKPRQSASSFAGRLGDAMELADVSAARLARTVNVDASLVAKYRSGVRVPQMNHPIIEAIAVALSERICALGRTAELGRRIGVSQEMLGGRNECARFLEGWLRAFSAVDTSLIESLLEGMDAFAPERKPPLPPAAVPAPEDDCAAYYDGPAGLQRAVLRFLGEAIRSGQKELRLYSDQNMAWLLGDRAFGLRWASLMSAYVGGGGRICIIHHIDRGLEEMLGAIRSWMPLYLSGGIESWYSLRRGGERFSHTLLLAPDSACITCTCAAHRESDARYHYVTDADGLSYCAALYDALLADCRPLLKLSPGDGTDRMPSMRRDREMHLLTRSISLGTMPEALLQSVLCRSALPEEKMRRVLADWTQRRELLRERLAYGALHECIALPTAEALAAHSVAVDTVYADLFYTPQEYDAHLRAALDLSKREGGYRIYPLEESPFTRIRLLTSNRTSLIVCQSGQPFTFATTHPLMCRAFVDYAGRLEQHHGGFGEALLARWKEYE
ncbi:MAG: hypothetical protein K6G54_02000 [Oscillospiraceae bacterium]|nr:hypothetical protein [Oscillospiraceae bacterium]